MLGGIATGDTRIRGFLASEDCLATLGALARAGRADRAARADPGHRSRRRRRRPARRAAAAWTWAMPARPCACRWGCWPARPFASTLIGDASLMRRPMERVAAPLRQMGAQITTQAGPTAGAAARRPAAAGHRLRHAHGQRAGEIRGAAGRPVRAGTHPGDGTCAHARSHRAHARRLRGAGGAGRAPRPAWSAASRCAARGIEVPADFSSAAFFLVAGALAAQRGPAAAQCRRQSDPHRAAAHAAADGRPDQRAPARRRRGGAGEPIADLRGARQRAARHRSARKPGAAVDR